MGTKGGEAERLDHYERVVEEIRRLSVDIDRMQNLVETVRGLEAFEARRCFTLAAVRLQEAGFWFGQGLKHAEKAGKLA